MKVKRNEKGETLETVEVRPGGSVVRKAVEVEPSDFIAETEQVQEDSCGFHNSPGFKLSSPKQRYCGRCGDELEGLVDSSDGEGNEVSVGRVVLGDVGSGLRKTARVSGRIAKKGAIYASYPVIGNLSRNLQESFLEIAGVKEERYMGDLVSCVTNGVVAGAVAGPYYNFNVLFSCAVGGLTMAVDFGIRIRHSERKNQGAWLPTASLPGKIVSYPIEAGIWAGKKTMGYVKNLGKRAREYSESVRERAENSSSLE